MFSLSLLVNWAQVCGGFSLDIESRLLSRVCFLKFPLIPDIRYLAVRLFSLVPCFISCLL